MVIEHKLANVVLHVDEHAERHPELYYRCVQGVCEFNVAESSLTVRGDADFLTYVNGLSAGKWFQYAGVCSIELKLSIKGSGEIRVVGVGKGEQEERVIRSCEVNAGDYSEISLSVETGGYDLIGFHLVASLPGALSVNKAGYYAMVDERRVNPISLAVATTTFNNERYILPNIELVKSGIAAEGGDIANHFHMFVVDNGRTLDVSSLSDDVVTILPNQNVGGSGGFARGMIAATENKGEYSHVIVMDDDVRIMPESIIRTYNLLSLAQGKYRSAFINGAMLSLEDPIRQFEDVSYVADTGVYRRVKGDIDAGTLDGMLENERTSVEVPRAYGAWWYSCIPTSAIDERGLPMPFFIRCDDVEFGMRNDPVYMTMNGICVWHASFEGRFRASVDCYQYTRNFLTMIAVDDCASERMFMLRLVRSVRMSLRDFDYTAAELTLDGLEDYLKGPSYLENLNGSELMKRNGARNEKLVPVAELDKSLLAKAGVTASVLADVDYSFHALPFMKAWRFFPYDKHYLPSFLLKRTPSYVVKNGEATLEGSSMRCRTIVHLDSTRKKGIVRSMDRRRFRAIRRRERDLLKRYRKEGREVRKSFKAAKSYLISREFWMGYLGI